MKKKKLLIAIIAAAVLAAAVLGWGTLRWLQPKFHDVTVELGSKQVLLDHFLTIYAEPAQAVFVTDMSGVRLDAVGTTPVTLAQWFREETVTLTVRDTTAPKVEFISHRTEGVDYIPKAEDFVKKAEDLSQVTVAFRQEPEIPGDYSDISLTVVVTDAYGNATEGVCKLSLSWLRSQVTLELGQTLTLADVLMDSDKDGALVAQEDLDAINGAAPGEYELKSTAGGKTMVCKVTVQDTTGPVLSLKQLRIYQGEELKAEELVESSADLSGPVTFRFAAEPDWSALGQQTVTVEAQDAFGNVTVGKTTVEIVADTEAPVINCGGKLTVAKNSEPDYLADVSAYDAHDGVCAVEVDASDVDLTEAGTYTLVYTAKDAAGNVVQKKRQVVVAPDKDDTAALVAKIAATLSSDPEEIRDYVRTIKYTSNWGGDDPVYFGFTQKHGNCYVHAMCLKVLLDAKGHETQLIWLEEQYSPHYWLLIKIDGKWKHIDATPGPTHTVYSLMNDQQRLETLKGRKWDFSAWPACE